MLPQGATFVSTECLFTLNSCTCIYIVSITFRSPQTASAASASALFSASQAESHSWNADTGASAHMTFNRHWMRNLRPNRTQIRLADGSVVYSEGVGSVRFNPVINVQEMP